MSTQESGRSTSLSKSLSDASIQSLSSILNNPHLGKSGVYSSDSSWTTWFSSSTPVPPQPDFPPILSTLSKSDVARSHFSQYISTISQNYSRFEDILHHNNNNNNSDQTLNVGQGDSLLACLREVPSLYFKEDFALEDGPTFRAACPFTNVTDNLGLQEKLSHYLDVVELHLVKEISLRSDSFFEAQGQLQDLNVKIVEGCSRIRHLKDTIRLLDKDLVESATNIQDLNSTRTNFLVLQHKLRLILYVNQALNALKLLVAAADCAGALDVTDDLQNLLDGDELTGLHCFRHLRDHVATSIDSVNSILSADFMRAAIHDAGDTDVLILSKAKARASVPMNGYDNDVRLDEEETSSFRDRLLPIIIGLLRTAKLPSVLRMYRDTLTADMKTAIKTAVAELLPILMVRPMESDFTPSERTVDGDGGGSLASKLRGLSSESFVHLLGAIFRIVQAHLFRAAEVKKAIEWIMSNLDGHFAADSVAAAIAIGAAAAEKTQESDGQLGSTFSLPSQRTAAKLPSQGKANDASVPSNMSRNFRADVLRENAEAVFAACDAAHGRWAKLLGVRALLHPKLRLQEFLSIYSITQDFITSTEKIGGRLGYSIRGTLQSQAKAFVDFQHEMRMTKIRAVLDQETWVEIDVPDEFQFIVASLFTSEAAISDDLHDAKSNLISSYGDTVTNNDGLLVDGTEASSTQLVRTDSSEVPMQNDGQVKSTSPESTESSKASTSSSHMANNDNVRKKGKSVCRTVLCGGVSYHMVNCGLILLKMLSEYVDMNSFLPALSSEVVHRVVELLKFFNTRTAQLVLGAGAMQVSGLKKITAKHLALASQVISFTYAIIPEIRRTLFLKVPETRKMLLMSEIDRVAQDYRVHRDEIHTKLVQIMRERVLTNLSHLPPILESWNRPEDADTQPSQVVRAIVKEVGFLQRVVSQTLHESDAQAIHRQVVAILHSQISEAYSRVEISTPQAKERLRRDVEHILGCIRSLPTDDSGSDTPNWGQLDEFLAQKFDTEAA